MEHFRNHSASESVDVTALPGRAPQTGSLLSPEDLYLFNEGTHFHLYDKLGAHPTTVQGVEGTYFAVWAPEAEQVSVFGTFNHWDPTHDPLRPCHSSGIWEGLFPAYGSALCTNFIFDPEIMAPYSSKPTLLPA